MQFLNKISNEFYMYTDKEADKTYTLQKGPVGVFGYGDAWRLRIEDKLIACFVINSDGNDCERKCYGGKIWQEQEMFDEADEMVRNAVLNKHSTQEVAIINGVLETVKRKYDKSVKENGGYDGRTDSYGYKMQINILEEVLRRIKEGVMKGV